MFSAWRKWRQQRAADQLEIDAAQWLEAEYALPFLDRLTDPERLRLRELARVFIAAKEWSAAPGLQLTARIQLSIALQACLPILNLGLDWYRGWVGIVVYPGDFVIPRQVVDADGVVHEYDDPVLGEAWEGGPVLISWFENLDEIGDVSIVIHEFAHKLDMSNGETDGMPALHANMRREDWIAAFQPAELAGTLNRFGIAAREDGMRIVPLYASTAAMRLDPSRPEYALAAIESNESLGRTDRAEKLRDDLAERWNTYERSVRLQHSSMLP